MVLEEAQRVQLHSQLVIIVHHASNSKRKHNKKSVMIGQRSVMRHMQPTSAVAWHAACHHRPSCYKGHQIAQTTEL
jgi:hypothetical protein